VLMEAMACGLAVVATRCGAVDELVEDILVDEGSPEQLATAIRKLATNPALRRSHGERNRKIVEASYSIGNAERFANELVSLQSDRSS
jgi:glycosyltransferase involved in cell wall biosynthesis